MKMLNHQYVGFILIAAAAILAAALVQCVGPGLVAVEHPPLPPPMVTSDGGITVVTGIQKTRFHYALIPLAAVVTIGFVLAMMPRRDEDNR